MNCQRTRDLGVYSLFEGLEDFVTMSATCRSSPEWVEGTRRVCMERDGVTLHNGCLSSWTDTQTKNPDSLWYCVKSTTIVLKLKRKLDWKKQKNAGLHSLSVNLKTYHPLTFGKPTLLLLDLVESVFLWQHSHPGWLLVWQRVCSADVATQPDLMKGFGAAVAPRCVQSTALPLTSWTRTKHSEVWACVWLHYFHSSSSYHYYFCYYRFQNWTDHARIPLLFF